MPTVARPQPASLALPESVTRLLEGTLQWTADHWRRALVTARDVHRRERRAVSRALCDAQLSHEGRALNVWLVKDAVQTTVESLSVRLSSRDGVLAMELLQDGALAMLARPSLSLHDLAVLVGPCLPLRLTEE